MEQLFDGMMTFTEARKFMDEHASFEERCEIARRTAITRDMTYEERLAAQRRRYGL